MKRRVLAGMVLAALLVAGGLAVRLNRKSIACKQRGEAYAARVDELSRDAHAQLKIGTKKDTLIRFFAEQPAR